MEVVIKKEKLVSSDVSTSDSNTNSTVEPTKKSTAEDETQTETVTKKIKNRKRKKNLHTNIRKQMEFYFSDANLSKDRFMQNAIKDGPEVPLEMFMNFNKLRALTEDIKEIAKALKFSKILKLSKDETKISRITPFCPKSQEEVDLCTIYVEHLPPLASIEWITNVFSKFGTVAYVSLPKFKDGIRIKGFAFVEFSDSESAFKAVKAYAPFRAYSLLVEDPGQLCSIQAFNAENQEFQEEIACLENKKPYPKQQTDEDSHEEEPKPKRQKVDEEVAKEDSSVTVKDGDKTKIKVEVETTANEHQDETKSRVTVKDGDETKIKVEEITSNEHEDEKKRKHSFNLNDDINLGQIETFDLQVMSKKEWKKLRNKYLDMQRKCLRQIRINARRQQTHEIRCEPSEVIKETILPEVITESPSIEFQPGLILKIALDEPISDAKRFKSQVKCQEGVTYVEAQDCCTVAFVRCIDAETALSLVSKKIWAQAEILQGEEERDYWKKIEENRLKKRDKSLRPKKSGAERARQKKETIIDADQPGYPTRATQHRNLHIRFDGNDD